MTIEELQAILYRGHYPVVIFKDMVENLETCIEGGMKGILLKIDRFDKYDAYMYALKFDLEAFIEHNKSIMSNDYDDAHGQFGLNAIQAGQWNNIETMVVDQDLESSDYFVIIDEVSNSTEMSMSFYTEILGRLSKVEEQLSKLNNRMNEMVHSLYLMDQNIRR